MKSVQLNIRYRTKYCVIKSLKCKKKSLKCKKIVSNICVWLCGLLHLLVERLNRALRTNNTDIYLYKKYNIHSNNYYNVIFGDRWLLFNVVVRKTKTEVLRRGTPATFKCTSLDKHFSSYSSTTTNEICEKHLIIHKVLRSDL
jgi:hypothetical protein